MYITWTRLTRASSTRATRSQTDASASPALHTRSAHQYVSCTFLLAQQVNSSTCTALWPHPRRRAAARLPAPGPLCCVSMGTVILVKQAKWSTFASISSICRISSLYSCGDDKYEYDLPGHAYSSTRTHRQSTATNHHLHTQRMRGHTRNRISHGRARCVHKH
jgi:hypothetical protein